MEQGPKPLALVGLALFILLAALFQILRVRRWKLAVKADFEAALQRLHIETYELLVDRNLARGTRRPPEIYRILRDHNGHYFLYLHSADGPGVLNPLTKERATLAVQVNG
ncbi:MULTISPECIES: hypothetical protein [unclassified Pseudomonas]|uniref:hypothetical protein n=1 Tax=unclassified Pseudomonas TaxID=196821 RepID=UPI002167E8DA|nr:MULTISPECIES: hypothetical protein [unclassified Pseudomonas]MCS3419158.1 hypothetical protein [Pseudomonas sp. BIGb0558]MCS3439942.1 hypothetical protein [Pseudomonas sp. BIGb0450]